ncbi:unnamed protein product [Linum trigynum]|uniref:Uncharacterized protein n=1 Tax=Linum trigynum TaxID=586398 RepID=A0AAV2E042_9ROSI
MAELAIPAPGHGCAPASFKTVFIDTNLDTRLALMISSSVTVADLKKKIMDEHPLCFPKLGEIKVDGLKVERRGFYYHLAESMLVTNAFDGLKEDWVVSIEASTVSMDKEVEPEMANLALMRMNNGLEEEGVNVVLDRHHNVMFERDLLVSQKESNDLCVEVARGAQLVGGDDCGDQVLSMVPLVTDEVVREEKCDEEKTQDMDVENTATGKDLSKIEASSVLPEGTSDVKEKRKNRKRRKKVVDDLSGENVDVSMHKLVTKGGEEGIKLSKTTASQERSEVDIVSVKGLLVCQKESTDLVEVALGARGDDCGDQVLSMVPLATDEFVRDEKCDEETQEMNMERTTIGKDFSNFDTSSVLPEGASNMKEKRKKKKRSKKRVDDLSGKDVDLSIHNLGTKGGEEEIKLSKTTGSQERSEVVISDIQIIVSKKGPLVSQKESTDLVEVARAAQRVGGDDCGDKVLSLVPLVSDEFVGEDNCDEEKTEKMDGERTEIGNELSKIDESSVLPEGASDVNEKRKKRKRSKKGADDLYVKNIDVSMHKLGAKGGDGDIKLPETTALQERIEVDIGDMQIIVSESNAMTCQLSSQSLAKKKRKIKSFKKVDKENVGITPGEASAGEEVPLKEAEFKSGTVAEEAPPSDTQMTQPSGVSLMEKDPDPLQEQQNNLPLQGINEFQEPTTNDMNRVETEQEVPKTVSTEVHKEVVDSVSHEVDPYVDDGKTSKKRKKSRKHKVLMCGTVSIASDADHVRDCYDVHEKVGKAENSILGAAEKGDVKEVAAADSPTASLLVTDKESDEFIKNAVESSQETTKTETVSENREGKLRKKTKKKKHGSDGKNTVLLIQTEDKCPDQSILAPSMANICGTDSSTFPYDAMAKICGTDSSTFPYDANLRNPSLKDSLDRAEILSPPEEVGGNAENASEVDGIDISSNFIPREQNTKTADPSEVTGAWAEMKSEKRGEVQEANLHDISPKLGYPTLKEKLEAHAKPQEKNAVPGIVDEQKPHCEEAQENAMTRPIGGKPNKCIEEHHSESLTNSSSHTKRDNRDQSQSQQTDVNGGGGYNAHPGEVVNDMLHQKQVVFSRSLFKQTPFGDDSDDSLESYHFPSPPHHTRASSPDPDLSVSPVHSDKETDAGFDSMNRNGSSGREGMKTPLDSTGHNPEKFKEIQEGQAGY